MPLCSTQGQPRPRYEVASRPSSGGCGLSDLGQASFHGAHTAGTAQRHWAEIPTEGGQATAHTRPSLSSHGSPEVDGPGRHPRLHSPHSTPAGEGAAWMTLWQVGHLGSLAWTAASPTALATLHMCHRYGPQAPHMPHVPHTPQTWATCSTCSTHATDTGAHEHNKKVERTTRRRIPVKMSARSRSSKLRCLKTRLQGGACTWTGTHTCRYTGRYPRVHSTHTNRVGSTQM